MATSSPADFRSFSSWSKLPSSLMTLDKGPSEGNDALMRGTKTLGFRRCKSDIMFLLPWTCTVENLPVSAAFLLFWALISLLALELYLQHTVAAFHAFRLWWWLQKSHQRVGVCNDLIACGCDDSIHTGHIAEGVLLVIAVGLIVQLDSICCVLRENESVFPLRPGWPHQSPCWNQEAQIMTHNLLKGCVLSSSASPSDRQTSLQRDRGKAHYEEDAMPVHEQQIWSKFPWTGLGNLWKS